MLVEEIKFLDRTTNGDRKRKEFYILVSNK